MTTRDDLVSRLRDNPFGRIHIDTKAGINEPTDMIREAADALEAANAEIARLAGELNQQTKEADSQMHQRQAAESRITSLERQLAEETERCARIAESFDMPLQRSGMKPQVIEVEKNIAAAIRGGAK